MNEQVEIDRLIRILRNSTPANRAQAVAALQNFGTAVADPLYQVMQDGDPLAHSLAMRCLGDLGDCRIVPDLCVMLTSTNADDVFLGMRYLKKFSDERVIPAFCRLLDHSHDGVRLDAVTYLGYLCDPLAIPALMHALHDKWPRLREIVADQLALIGTPAIPVLREALEDQPDIRPWVIRALSQIRNVTVIPDLCDALKDDDPQIRCACVGALAQFDDENALSTSIKVLQSDKDTEVHLAALYALIGRYKSDLNLLVMDKHLSPAQRWFLYKSHYEHRSRGHGSPDVLRDSLKGMLQHPTPGVREGAQEILTYISSPSAKRTQNDMMPDGNKGIKAWLKKFWNG